MSQSFIELKILPVLHGENLNGIEQQNYLQFGVTLFEPQM